MTGRHFTTVAGTFDVPTLDMTSCNPMATEWVGLGGHGHALLQAGVAETCKREILPWWYQLPADWTPRSLRQVSIVKWWDNGQAAIGAPGDQVRVTISRVGQERWAIRLTDLSTNGAWAKTVRWTGTAPSAEWIVEDPNQTGGDKACTWHPTPRSAYCPMPAFSSVKFTNLATFPAQGTWTALHMRDRSGQIMASPGPLTPAGFTVRYLGKQTSELLHSPSDRKERR